MADRVVQIAMSGEGGMFALTEQGRVYALSCGSWKKIMPIPGCEPAEAEDPWRDLTDEETRQVAEYTRDSGFLCGFGGARKVFNAIRKVREVEE